MSEPAFTENVHLLSEKRTRALNETDNMSPELRRCVHEYGYAIVNACLCAKVTDPRRIHQLVREIWDGARQPCQSRPKGGTLDWLLIQAGAGITAATLMRILHDNSLAVVPLEPSNYMVEASKATLANHDERVTKTEKHRRRLRAAISAGVKHLWPQLDKTA
jgi:hypothetical protein